MTRRNALVLRNVRAKQKAKSERQKKVDDLIEEIRFWRETAWRINGPFIAQPAYVFEVIAALERRLAEARA